MLSRAPTIAECEIIILGKRERVQVEGACRTMFGGGVYCEPLRIMWIGGDVMGLCDDQMDTVREALRTKFLIERMAGRECQTDAHDDGPPETAA